MEEARLSDTTASPPSLVQDKAGGGVRGQGVPRHQAWSPEVQSPATQLQVRGGAGDPTSSPEPQSWKFWGKASYESQE